MHSQLYLPTCTHTCSRRHLCLHLRTQTSGCIKGPPFSLPVVFVDFVRNNNHGEPNSDQFFSADEKSRAEGKGKEEKRKGRRGKGETEKEIGSEALAETEKIANALAGNQTRDPSKRG